MARKDALSTAAQEPAEDRPCVGLKDSPLEKIIFPFIAIKRAEDEDKLPLPLAKSRLAFQVDGSLHTKNHPQNGHCYAILKLTLKAMAKDAESGAEVIAVALTCLGYFRCDKSHDLGALDAYLVGNHEEFARRGVDHVYPAAVLEFDRLVRQTGLPTMNINPSPPAKLKVAIEQSATPKKAPRKTAAKRRAPPPKQP